MQQRLIILFFFTIFAFSLKAQKLAFNEEGTFKIVQFTDMHYMHNDPRSDTALLMMERVLDLERPDLVIFTGDIVTGTVREGWDAITQRVIEREIPFAATLGNHDHEQGVTREEIARIVTSYPYNVNSLSTTDADRVMDNVIPVYRSTKDLHVSALVYCFDSGAYSTLDGVKGYGWITTEQIEWYKQQSLHYTVRNNFEPLPALAYFHIPLPEYRTAFNDENNIRFGVRMEDECPPDLNSGMFLAMREMRDVMATFAGHDHVNNYIVDYHGIALAYGCFSGWKTTYTPERNGVRVVVMKKNKREFDTWLHFLDGTIRDKVTFPVDFAHPDK